jgi:hydroxymethylpyrimidine pyrophosphatase-like HAD family hydrolase
MKLAVIALDFDGTIARADTLDPAVHAAIAAARRRGLVVLIVTGRRLDDLKRVAGELHFVDAVVAENGAVLYFPDSGYTAALAPEIPQVFVQELVRRGVPFAAGSSLIDAAADQAPRLLDAIRQLQQPLVLLFNGGRVMVLPQGVTKATGLRHALETLRLSARNTLAIGDAENDHELLRLAEVGAAVEWGSAALREVADVVIPGHGPADVATYLRTLTSSLAMPQVLHTRRSLRLGHTVDGAELRLAVRGRNVLIAGDARSGKSWVAGLLCEGLILNGYSVCAIDPEGDYRALEVLPGVMVLGGDDPPPKPREIIRALRYPDRSLVVDLSQLRHEEKVEYVRGLLPALGHIRKQTGLPHRILVDEAHYFLHDPFPEPLIDPEQGGYTLVTYRASRLPPEILRASLVMIVTRESNPAEVEALAPWCAGCDTESADWKVLGHLRPGQAVVLPMTDEASGGLRLFTIAARLTPHVRHREKYVDVPVPDSRAFVFERGPIAPSRARTLRQFVAALESAPEESFDAHLRRGDFSRWINDVFGDFPLAQRLRALEDRHRVGTRAETIAEVAAAIRARYDLADGSEDEPAA